MTTAATLSKREVWLGMLGIAPSFRNRRARRRVQCFAEQVARTMNDRAATKEARHADVSLRDERLIIFWIHSVVRIGESVSHK